MPRLGEWAGEAGGKPVGQVSAFYSKSRVCVGRTLGGFGGVSVAPCPVLSQSGLFGQEKRKRQAEMDSKRRQLEDDRRQLQHLKVPNGQILAL